MAAAKKAAAAKAAPKAASAAASTTDTAAEGAGSEQGREDDAQDGSEAETIKPAEGEAFVLVRKGLERFHRCGMRFTREPTVLVLADLDEGVLDRLKAEPNLVVVEG